MEKERNINALFELDNTLYKAKTNVWLGGTFTFSLRDTFHNAKSNGWVGATFYVDGKKKLK